MALCSAAPLAFSQITFAPVVPYDLPTLAQSGVRGCVVSGDFNGDGRPDVAVCGGGGIWLFMNKGDGTFSPPFPFGSPVSGLTAVDLNHDGHVDVIAVMGSTLQVYLNQGFGTFQAPISYALPSASFGGMLSGDFNGDGKKDVAVTLNCCGNASGGTIVYYGKGDGTLVPSAPFNVPALMQPYGSSQFLSAVGDVNGDGIDDLIVDKFDGGFQVFFGQHSGIFSTPAVYSFFTSYASYHLADVNGDGSLDIVAGNQYSGFFVMLNDGTGAFGPVTNIDPVAWPGFGYGLFLSIADFNNDALTT